MHHIKVANAYDCHTSTANILGHRKEQKTSHLLDATVQKAHQGQTFAGNEHSV